MFIVFIVHLPLKLHLQVTGVPLLLFESAAKPQRCDILLHVDKVLYHIYSKTYQGKSSI